MDLGRSNPGISQMPGTLKSPCSFQDLPNIALFRVSGVLTCVACTCPTPPKLALSRPSPPSLLKSSQAPNTRIASSMEEITKSLHK